MSSEKKIDSAVQRDEANENDVNPSDCSEGETDSFLLAASTEECVPDIGYAVETPALPDTVPRVPMSLSIQTLSRCQHLVLGCLMMAEVTIQMCLYIMAPFFPSEASKKGVSSTLSGWIFAVFSLVQFAVSPLFGRLIPHLGSRLLIITGQLLLGGCTILFGFLDHIGTADNNAAFIAYCFILRIILAIGCTASTTSGFAIAATVFPNHIATICGLLETASGLGMMIGPAFGGILYQFGGFTVPFVFLGTVVILLVPLHMLWLPSIDDIHAEVQTISLLRILRIPSVIVVCFAIIIATVVYSVLDPTLAPHIHCSETDISSSVLGLIFLLLSAFYTVSSPVWGCLADRISNCMPMLAGGFLLSGVGLLLLGPSPWLSFIGYTETNEPLWLNIISLMILGMSISLSLVPTCHKILEMVEKAGIEESFAVYSVVAGIWTSCYALGDFIGPALGGWLLDQPGGFVWSVTYVAIACFAMATIVILLWLFESQQCRLSFSTCRTCLLCFLKSRTSDHAGMTSSDASFTSDERSPLLIQ